MNLESLHRKSNPNHSTMSIAHAIKAVKSKGHAKLRTIKQRIYSQLEILKAEKFSFTMHNFQ